MLIEEELKIKKGVLVEPNPQLVRLLKEKRGNNRVIGKGVGTVDGIMTYYLMSADTLNTFSEREVDNSINDGYSIVGKIQVEIIEINRLLHTEFSDGNLDYLSIDVEGMDLQIIKSIDYGTIAPRIICIETASRGTDLGKGDEFKELVNFLREKQYVIYADTLINTIFVKKEAVWKNFGRDIIDIWSVD